MTLRVLLSAAAATLTLTACSAAPRLDPPADPTLRLPPASPPSGMRLSAIPTGTLASRAAMAYEGGAFGDKRDFVVGAILVEHPKGALLFDTGLGKDAAEHIKTVGLLLRLASKLTPGTPAADQLRAAGRDPAALTAVVLTHAHWDHVSGLAELPGVPVWVPAVEREFANSAEAGKLARQLGVSAYRSYDFPGGPYLGFPKSYDVFGDGSVVLVPAPGHTPGSVIAFLALPDGKRYALIGDLAWQAEGVKLPAERPGFARRVDADPDQVRAGLARMHQIQEALPQIIVVPAHDSRVWKTLPPLSPAP